MFSFKHSIYMNIIFLKTTYVSQTSDRCTSHAVHEPYFGHPCHKHTGNSHNYPTFSQHCKFKKKKRSNIFYLTKMCCFVYIVQKSLQPFLHSFLIIQCTAQNGSLKIFISRAVGMRGAGIHKGNTSVFGSERIIRQVPHQTINKTVHLMQRIFLHIITCRLYVDVNRQTAVSDVLCIVQHIFSFTFNIKLEICHSIAKILQHTLYFLILSILCIIKFL